MLSGDNSILQKSTEAKTRSDEAQIIERIQLAYHSALTGGQGSYTKESLESELEKEFGENNYNVDDSDNKNWILTAKGQSVIISAGIKTEQPSITTAWSYSHSAQTVSATLSNGEVLTLNIGDYIIDTDTQIVTNFDGYWRVLGVENGQLLLVTSANNVMDLNSVTISGVSGATKESSKMKLSGADGWNNAELALNSIGEQFNLSGKFENGRSINVNDINIITGYNPNNVGVNDTSNGTGTKYSNGIEYGTSVKYRRTSGKIEFSTNGGTSYTTSSQTNFRELGSNSNITNNPITLTQNYYYYYPSTLTTSDSDSASIGIAKNSIAYDMLFARNEIKYEPYWLASLTTLTATNGTASWGVRSVYADGSWDTIRVMWDSLWFSGLNGGNANNPQKCVRPVVRLTATITPQLVLTNVGNKGINIYKIGSGLEKTDTIIDYYAN